MTNGPCASDSTNPTASPLNLTISTFSSETDTTPLEETLTWDALRLRLTRYSVRDGKSGPAWSPVRYAEGASRGNAGVECVTVAVMDVDDGTDPELVHRHLTELGFEHVIHSTHSSIPEHPKFRAIVPLANPCSAASWPAIFPRLCVLLTDGHTDPGTKDPARLFFLPSAKAGGRTFTYSGHGNALLPSDLPPAEETSAAGSPTVPLDAGGKLPHGRHYEWLRSLTASLASRTAGITEAQIVSAVVAAFGEVGDDLPAHEGEIALLARSAVEKFGRPESAADSGTDAALWPDLLEFFRAHYHFAETDEWAYTVVGLLTLERWVSDLLPAVFSAAMAGTVGRGKTRLGELVRDLTGAELASNVSPAALARTWRFGNLCVMDEADEGRGREQQEMLDAFMRAYRPGTGLYKRVKDPKTGEVETIDLYGPRLILGRSSAEAGIQSRCYDLPPGEPLDGEQGFAFVTRGMYPEFRDLRGRLERFSVKAHREWPRDRVEALVRSPEFPARVGRIVRRLGSNRESETGAVAAVVAEIVGVDVSEAMRRADEARKGTASTEGDELELLMEAVLEVLPANCLLDDGGEISLKQPAIRKAFNALLKREGVRAPGNVAFSKLRLDLGVGSGWTTERGGSLVWHVPARVVRSWRETVSTVRPPVSSLPTSPPSSPSTVRTRKGLEGLEGRSGDEPRTETGGLSTQGQVRAATRASFNEAMREEGELP